jgi:hypothetical protein
MKNWEKVAGEGCAMRSFTFYSFRMIKIKAEGKDRESSRHRGDEKYRILVGKPERKRPLGRRKRRWGDNI